MSDRPSFLASGDQARIFPVLAETSREKRVASIFLAVMTQIPALAEDVLATVGMRVGKRTRVRAYTEVVLRNEIEGGCRPDGLVVVDTGKSTWSALVEAKIGRNGLVADQVQRYLELARANGIDAVITISNEFVARADHCPVQVPKTLLRKTGLFHWAWPWLATVCEILEIRKKVDDPEQTWLLAQLNHFLAHPATGIERMTEMAPSWKEVAQAVTTDGSLKRTSPEVEAAVASWLAEERDLCLHMSSHVGREVTARVERRFTDDPVARLKDQVATLADTHVLKSAIRVPDCASDMEVVRRHGAPHGLRLDAPEGPGRPEVDQGPRQLAPPDAAGGRRRAAHPRPLARPGGADDEGHQSRPTGPRRAPDGERRRGPARFEVILVESLGKRFSGRRTFVEDIERIVPAFYDLVGVNLKAWQAAPPRPVKSRDEPDPGELEWSDLEPGGALPAERQAAE